MSISRKRTYYILIFITCIYFIVLTALCDMKSLWSDDLAQMEIALKPSLKTLLGKCISLDNNPPFSHILSAIWIRLVPYGCGWLKVFNIFVVTLGIFICGIVSIDLIGQWAGILTTGLCGLNLGLVAFSAYTFRPYGLLFLLSALLLFVYERNRRKTPKIFELDYFFVILLSVYTHYFMIFVCGVLFLADLLLVIRKKLRINVLYAYFAAAIGFVPWLLLVLKNSLERLQNFWPQTPDFGILISSMEELNGTKSLLLIIIAGNILWLIKLLKGMWHCGKERNELQEIIILGCLIILPVIVVISVYLLSRYSSGLTSLFVTRYFVCILPELYIAAGCGIAIIINRLVKSVKWKKTEQCLRFLLVSLITLGIIGSGYKIYLHEKMPMEPFREVADYLAVQDDIEEESVLVYNTSYERDASWDYFLSHKGKRNITIDSRWEQLKQDDLQGKNKVYVAILHNELTNDSLEILYREGFYQTQEIDEVPILIFERG